MSTATPNSDRRRSAARASWRAILCGALALAGAASSSATNREFRPADLVVVVKSEHRLYLVRDGQTYRSFRVWLGLDPSGPKEREGDFRTPEGRYVLDARNAHSDYYLALHVSYPNESDARRARARGVAPGGSIMIHGQPNTPRRPTSYYLSTDWTNGCIALTNDDMLEVWLLTRPDTPIEIRP
jgi:murein L,D-transpeptidase YafK